MNTPENQILIVDDYDHKRRELRTAVRAVYPDVGVVLAESPDDVASLLAQERILPGKLAVAFIDGYFGGCPDGDFKTVSLLREARVPIVATPRDYKEQLAIAPDTYVDSCVVVSCSFNEERARAIGAYSPRLGYLCVDWMRTPVSVLGELEEARRMRSPEL